MDHDPTSVAAPLDPLSNVKAMLAERAKTFEQYTQIQRDTLAGLRRQHQPNGRGTVTLLDFGSYEDGSVDVIVTFVEQGRRFLIEPNGDVTRLIGGNPS